jgi:hypothetical protein
MLQSTIRGNGRYRGAQSVSRGNFRGDSRYKFKQAEPNWPPGKLVKAINISGLSVLDITPKIEKFEYLASYNWLEFEKQPTILVPGTYSLPEGHSYRTKLTAKRAKVHHLYGHRQARSSLKKIRDNTLGTRTQQDILGN